MPEGSGPRSLIIHTRDGVALAGQEDGAQRGVGSAPPIVLLHGLTATRRYVVMGSRVLQRSGFRVISYDARGHGRSDPAPEPGAYGYGHLAADLLAVLDMLGVERAILAGASMGAHTIVRFALDHPERVAALGLITPAYLPLAPEGTSASETNVGAATPSGGAEDADEFAAWNALARGLREGGVAGFMAAYDFQAVPEAWRATVETVIRQRLSKHEHPEAVADALEVVPRSRPFDRIDQLAALATPTVVIASRDEADPDHPLAVGERYAKTIPSAELIVEGPGRSPIAWQGGQLSKVLLRLTHRP